MGYSFSQFNTYSETIERINSDQSKDEVSSVKVMENGKEIVFSKQFLNHIESKLEVEVDSIMVSRRLSGGLRSENYVITSVDKSGEERKSFLLRFTTIWDYPGKQSLLSEKEFETLNQVRKSGCSPKPLYVDSSKNMIDREYLIMEFFQGRDMKGSDFRGNPDRIANFARMLRQMHDSMPLLVDCDEEFVKLRSDYFESVHRFDLNLFEKRIFDEEFDLAVFTPVFKKTVSEAMQKYLKITDFIQVMRDYLKAGIEILRSKTQEKFWEDYKETKKGSLRLIHGDFHIKNLMVEIKEDREEVFKVIDWEMSRFGTVYEDLCLFLCTVHLSDEEEGLFLKTYLKGEKLEEELFEIVKLQYCMVVLLVIADSRIAGPVRKKLGEMESCKGAFATKYIFERLKLLIEKHKV